MWGELPLYSSFFRNLTKSCYCASYFFSCIINTIFLFILHSDSCRRLPNTCTLKKAQQCKERVSPEGDHALLQLLTHARQFFSSTTAGREHNCCSCPWKHPSALQVFGNSASTTARVVRGYTGFKQWHFTWMTVSMVSGVAQGVTHSGVGHTYVPPWGNEVWREGPVSSALSWLELNSLWWM